MSRLDGRGEWAVAVSQRKTADPPAEQQAVLLFAEWARLNPTITDPDTLVRVWRAYRLVARIRRTRV